MIRNIKTKTESVIKETKRGACAGVPYAGWNAICASLGLAMREGDA